MASPRGATPSTASSRSFAVASDGPVLSAQWRLRVTSRAAAAHALARFTTAYPVLFKSSVLLSLVNMRLKLGEADLAVACYERLLSDARASLATHRGGIVASVERGSMDGPSDAQVEHLVDLEAHDAQELKGDGAPLPPGDP